MDYILYVKKYNKEYLIQEVRRKCCTAHTRGVQKVRRPTQLTTRHAHHVLSLFDIFSCNWNALGPGFLQNSHSVVEELLFLVFQPAICRADNVLVVRNFVSFHEFFSLGKTQVTWSQDNVPDHTSAQALASIQNAGFELLFTDRIRHSYSYCAANGWLEDQEQQYTTESELWRNTGLGAF